MQQLKQQQQQQLAKAVAAKIAHLENEKTLEGVILEGAGAAAPNQVRVDPTARPPACLYDVPKIPKKNIYRYGRMKCRY